MSNLIPGRVYTMGASKRIGDRSYIGHLWVVLAQTETAVVITGFGDKSRSGSWHNTKHVIDKSEYVFTDAMPLVSAMTECAA